jgi:hypothetical protein
LTQIQSLDGIHWLGPTPAAELQCDAIDGNKTVLRTSLALFLPGHIISQQDLVRSPVSNATSQLWDCGNVTATLQRAGYSTTGGLCTGTVNPCVVTVDGADGHGVLHNSAYKCINNEAGGTVTLTQQAGHARTLVTLTHTCNRVHIRSMERYCAGQASCTDDGRLESVSATFLRRPLPRHHNNPAEGGHDHPSAGCTYPYGTVVACFRTGYKFNGWTLVFDNVR